MKGLLSRSLFILVRVGKASRTSSLGDKKPYEGPFITLVPSAGRENRNLQFQCPFPIFSGYESFKNKGKGFDSPTEVGQNTSKQACI